MLVQTKVMYGPTPSDTSAMQDTISWRTCVLTTVFLICGEGISCASSLQRLLSEFVSSGTQQIPAIFLDHLEDGLKGKWWNFLQNLAKV